MRLLGIGADASCARGLRGPHHRLMEEFSRHWERIDYLCPHHPEARDTTLFGNVHFHVAPPSKFRRLSWLTSTGKRLLEEHHHDIMGIHEYPPFINGIAARRLTRLTGVPHILEIYHVEGHPKAADIPEFFRRLLTGWYVGFAHREAARIRVINRTQTPRFLEDHGVPADKLLLLYSSYTDLETFHPGAAAQAQDVLFIGRLVRNKGLDTLIEALRLVPGATARIVGTGPLRPALEATLAKGDLAGRVTFHGWAQDETEIAGLIRASGMLVCASLSEGGPRTTLEAMACGVPVISTPVGTMPDMIVHRQNGCLTGFDAASLATEIAFLRDNPAEARRIGLAGREAMLPFERRALIKAYAEGYQAVARELSR
ncbi:MAG: glycosyltransferase family 4 protein [Planctomycetota bacterium]